MLLETLIRLRTNAPVRVHVSMSRALSPATRHRCHEVLRVSTVRHGGGHSVNRATWTYIVERQPTPNVLDNVEMVHQHHRPQLAPHVRVLLEKRGVAQDGIPKIIHQ